MKIPKRIKIGGLWYKIILEDSFNEGKEEFGSFNPVKQIIKLNCKQSDHNKMSTLLHEIIEGINCMYELELQHSHITILETALFQVLIDNKMLREN